MTKGSNFVGYSIFTGVMNGSIPIDIIYCISTQIELGSREWKNFRCVCKEFYRASWNVMTQNPSLRNYWSIASVSRFLSKEKFDLFLSRCNLNLIKCGEKVVSKLMLDPKTPKTAIHTLMNHPNVKTNIRNAISFIMHSTNNETLREYIFHPKNDYIHTHPQFRKQIICASVISGNFLLLLDLISPLPPQKCDDTQQVIVSCLVNSFKHKKYDIVAAALDKYPRLVRDAQVIYVISERPPQVDIQHLGLRGLLVMDRVDGHNSYVMDIIMSNLPITKIMKKRRFDDTLSSSCKQ